LGCKKNKIKKINKNKMKNNTKKTQPLVDVFSIDGKYKGVSRPVEYEGEKYILKENEVIFYLRENPNCQVQAVGTWRENMQGKMLGNIDTYFIHVCTGRRCNNVWAWLSGLKVSDKKTAEEWETICRHIEDLPNLEKIICKEKRVEV